MSLKDFALMVGVCLVWGLSNVVSKILLSTYGMPPLLLVGARFMLVAAVTLPWLLPAPKPLWRVILVGLLIGGGSFALMFVGLETTSPSAAAIVGQLGLPVTTLLSVVMLGEAIHWPRRIGIVLTFIGVVIVMWTPGRFAPSAGLLLMAASAVASSFGAVLMKQVEGVKPLKMQAWVAVSSILPVLAVSAWLEPHAVQQAWAAPWAFAAGVVFSALVVSVGAHTLYYHLIQRYEANLVSPLTLMAPIFTIGFGVAITHDPFGWRMALGSLIALSGVLIIALRRSHVGVAMLWLRERI